MNLKNVLYNYDVNIFEALILLLLGLCALLFGARFLVSGAVTLARKYKISERVIGLTLVAIGTSLPELAFNIQSASVGNSGLALGNILGSNYANLFFILGTLGILYQFKFKPRIVRFEIPILIFVGFLVAYFSLNFHPGLSYGTISSFEGILLLALYLLYLYYLTRQREEKLQLSNSGTSVIEKFSLPILLRLLFGLILLPIGASLTQHAALSVSEIFGISVNFVGFSIVALGTSLPEFAVSIISARKGHYDLAVGNIIGSNIANLLLILGLSAVITPLVHTKHSLDDLLVSLFASIALLIALYTGKKFVIQRYQGIVLLVLYVAYLAYAYAR